VNDRAQGLGVAEIVAAAVRPEIRALSAYAVANAEGMVKLDAMENPHALPEAAKAALVEALARVPINRYPDGGAHAVRVALREAFAIPGEAALIVGNGSDELIQIITAALARPGATMLAPEPSFVMYRMNALYSGMRYMGVALGSDFALDQPAMLAAIERERPVLIYLAYPNNPTGNLFDARGMEAILRAAPGLVVVDEAYYAFAEASFLPRVGEFPNLLVLRTLSKVGMAGLRLGYAVAAPEWIAEFNKLRQPYNVNALTQAAIVALLADRGWIDEQACTIRSERERVSAALAQLHAVRVYPTQTNFIVIRVPDAGRMFMELKNRRILVKNLHGWHPLLDQCLRITVGTAAENNLVLAACAELCR
jgi:histidinol-phosphate aminotransferase